MRKILDAVTKPFWFTVVTLLYLPINMMSVVNVLPFTRYALAVLCVWGFAVLFRTYVLNGKKPYTIWILMLIAFLAVCGVTELINFKYGGLEQLLKLYFMGICMLIFFAQFGVSKEERRKELYILSHGIPIICSVAFLVSFYMYLTVFTYNLALRSGGTAHIGFSENRLVGVFSSSNVGGTYAIITIFLILVAYLLRKKDNKLNVGFYIFGGLCLLFSFVFIALSLSKGSYLSLFFFLAVLGVLWPTKKAGILPFVAKFAVVLAGCVVIYFGMAGAQKGMSYAMKKLNTVQKPTTQTEQKVDEKTDEKTTEKTTEKAEEKAEIVERASKGWEGRTESGRTDIDFTNKRSSIWLGTLNLLKGKQLFTGLNNSFNYYKQNAERLTWLSNADKTFIVWSHSNAHNGYLQVLMECGVIAFIILLVFIVAIMIKYLFGVMKSYREKRAQTDSRLDLALICVMLAFCVTILENNVYESNFANMGTNFFQATFWFMLGAVGNELSEIRK